MPKTYHLDKDIGYKMGKALYTFGRGLISKIYNELKKIMKKCKWSLVLYRNFSKYKMKIPEKYFLTCSISLAFWKIPIKIL